MAISRYRRNGHWSGHETASQAELLDPLWLRILRARGTCRRAYVSFRAPTRRGKGELRISATSTIGSAPQKLIRARSSPLEQASQAAKLSALPRLIILQSLRQPPLSMPRIDWKPNRSANMRAHSTEHARCRKARRASAMSYRVAKVMRSNNQSTWQSTHAENSICCAHTYAGNTQELNSGVREVAAKL